MSQALRCRANPVEEGRLRIELEADDGVLVDLDLDIDDYESSVTALRSEALPHMADAVRAGVPVELGVTDDAMCAGVLLGAALDGAFDAIEVPQHVVVIEPEEEPEAAEVGEDGLEGAAEAPAEAASPEPPSAALSKEAAPQPAAPEPAGAEAASPAAAAPASAEPEPPAEPGAPAEPPPAQEPAAAQEPPAAPPVEPVAEQGPATPAPGPAEPEPEAARRPAEAPGAEAPPLSAEPSSEAGAAEPSPAPTEREPAAGQPAPAAAEAPTPAVRAPAPAALSREAKDLLHTISQQAFIRRAPPEELVERARALPGAPADLGRRIERTIALAVSSRELVDDFERALASRDPRRVASLRTRAEETPGWVRRKLEQQEARHHAQRARQSEEVGKRRAGAALSSVRPGATGHSIQGLAPSPRWSLLVDETGRIPERGPAEPRGKFVGLLVPEGASLPPLEEGWHAAERASHEDIDRAVQAVLDAPVGVLGLTVEALAPGQQDRWAVGVLELVSWVARLLPIEGPTTLSVCVEQHGLHRAGLDWEAAASELWRQLADINRARAHRLVIEIRLIAKTGHPYNGYVDALALTFGAGSPSARERLERSGLLGSCLLSGDARALQGAWDKLGKGASLSGDEWGRLVLDPDAGRPASIAAALLGQLESACRQDATLWARFFEAAQRHLDSKAVDLRAVGRQLAWLERSAPQGRELPAQMRLALLTARREELNHHGQLDAGLDAELDSLGAQLFEENATLVCQADLVRAVEATNRFDFEGASKALARWVEAPPAVPGLQHWGRVRSSLGQHAAFGGDPGAALSLFDQAIQAFGRLSDKSLAAAERAQTACYRAIATMDRAEASAEEVRAAVSEIAALAPEAIAELAASVEPARKYAHHLLLRYLAHRGAPEERQAYLSARDRWGSGEGHPWPLIEAYRALLLRESDPEAAQARIAAACELTEGEGPTVRFIGLVLSAIGEGWGAEVGISERDFAELRARLPLAPWTRLAAGFETAGQAPLDLMKACLPFNFR